MNDDQMIPAADETTALPKDAESSDAAPVEPEATAPDGAPDAPPVDDEAQPTRHSKRTAS